MGSLSLFIKILLCPSSWIAPATMQLHIAMSWNPSLSRSTHCSFCLSQRCVVLFHFLHPWRQFLAVPSTGSSLNCLCCCPTPRAAAQCQHHDLHCTCPSNSCSSRSSLLMGYFCSSWNLTLLGLWKSSSSSWPSAADWAGAPAPISPYSSAFLSVLACTGLSIQAQHPCRCSAHRDCPTNWPRLQSALQLGIDFCRQSLPTALRQLLHWLGVPSRFGSAPSVKILNKKQRTKSFEKFVKLRSRAKQKN